MSYLYIVIGGETWSVLVMEIHVSLPGVKDFMVSELVAGHAPNKSFDVSPICPAWR